MKNLTELVRRVSSEAFVSKSSTGILELNNFKYGSEYRAAELVMDPSGQYRVNVYAPILPDKAATFLYGGFDEPNLPDQFFNDCLDLEFEMAPEAVLYL